MSRDAPPTAKGVVRAFFNLALATLFYPLGIAAIIWIAWKGYHWGWAALILAGLLVCDPIWLRLLRSVFRRR